MTARTTTVSPQVRHWDASGRDALAAIDRPERGPWAPLTIAEANVLLREGGYGLRVEQRGSGSVSLTGTGAGVGLPLGFAPTWADLYRALVRLRRTRERHDPSYLHELTRHLDGDGPRPTWDTRWVRLPAERVRRLTASGAPNDEVARRLSVVVDGDGSVLFPAEHVPGHSTVEQPGLVLDRAGEQVTVGRGDGFGVEWSVRLTDGLDRAGAERQLEGWSRLAPVVEDDPLLRMHCAVQPAPAALVDSDTGTAMLAQLTEPAPPHPKHPGGTVVASLPGLIRQGACGTPVLLRQVIENRFEHREDELGYFVEHLVRPLLRTFRLALDGHRLGLFSLDERGVGFELSPELQATGRVVLTDFARIHESAEVTDVEVREGVEALVGTIDVLTSAFSRIDFGGGAVAEHVVRAAVDQVTAEELKYLQEHTAELLSCEQPLRCFAHTVPVEQDAILKDVLHVVQERTRERRWAPRLPQAAVVIDLDLCGIVPLQRTFDAARSICGPRPGAPTGIPELANPGSLPVLPTYAVSTWHTFVETSGLGAKYPEVDWQQAHDDFFRAFARPWEKLRTDTVNAGLARFVWDVQDAGGRVVFCTGRRERVRAQTEEVLAAEGVPDSLLLCMPDDRQRPISELKVEKLRELGGDLDVVAVFDDMVANRIAITKEFRDAVAVAVEIPGLVAERHPRQPTPDRAPVIATFEVSPSPTRRASTGSGLSNTHSLEELQVGALRHNRSADRWAVHLSAEESFGVVESLRADTDRAAERTTQGARTKFELDRRWDQDEQTDRVIRALHHVFTRKQFLKGARSNYQAADMRRDVEPFVRGQEPIDVVLLGFPVKQCLNRLKAAGPLPDLAELGGLMRLRELQRAVRGVYPPGLRFNILTDGRHFRPRPAAITEAYSRKLREYVAMVGLEDDTVVEEIDAVAIERFGSHLPAERSERISHYRALLARLLDGFDITDNPLRTLESITAYSSTVDGSLAQAVQLFPEMLMSVVYSVPVPAPAGCDRLAWSSRVYADLYNLGDRTVTPRVRQARVAVLRRAWHTVVRYLAIMRVDEELGYEELFPNRVRLTVSAARPGRCGFTYLGGSGLLPWQGTGAVDPRGRLSIDFAVSLIDQGFVPVYSPLLGPRQPWLMVPAQHTLLHGASVRLDDEFAERIRLRRR